MSKSKKIAVDKNLLNYMFSNVSERTICKNLYNTPLKSFYLDYKHYLAAQKLSLLTYNAFREEFGRILKYRYPSAQIVRWDRRYIVLNLVQSTLIESHEKD